MDERPTVPRRAWSRWHVRPLAVAAAAAVAVLGTGASAAAGAALGHAQHRIAAQAMDQRATLMCQILQAETRRYADTLRMSAAATGAFEELTAAKFAGLTAPVRDLQLAGATSITFLVAAAPDEIKRVQAHWRTRGTPELTLRPHGGSPEHAFVVFSQPLQSGSHPQPGLDVSQVPALARALEESRASGRTVVSDAYQLLIDRSLPPERRQTSLVIVAPVYGPAAERGSFIGWVSMGVRGQDFAGATLQRIAAGRADVRLSARQADGSLVPLAAITVTRPAAGRRDLHRTADVAVGQRSWQLRIDAAGAALPGATSGLPAVTTAGGTTLSLLAAALVFTLAGGRARARAQVEAATAVLRADQVRLRTAHDELAAHRAYLTQVLDAIEVTVITCDADGAIVHLNQVARTALPADAPVTAAELASRLPLLHSDGTPLVLEEIPLIRSLRGEEVDDIEAVVMLPDGTRRILRLHARPLRHPDGRIIGAVTSSYDITALREHQAELQAFAGVVAHDLKRPLSAVRGFAELARDDLEEEELDQRAGQGQAAALTAEHARHLDRILSGAAQMTRLIEDLLTYASARDATLHPSRIDLTALMREVTDEHLAADPADPTPQVRIEPLPEVYADAALVRRLVDNLIGNALKYTPAGRPAQVEISTRPAPAGWVCVQVADRGIGIPAGEHQAIFTSFHRATQSYSGTGLGLAICRRVVARHGGTITATDNPGGGACFTFTLPAASDDQQPDG